MMTFYKRISVIKLEKNLTNNDLGKIIGMSGEAFRMAVKRESLSDLQKRELEKEFFETNEFERVGEGFEDYIVDNKDEKLLREKIDLLIKENDILMQQNEFLSEKVEFYKNANSMINEDLLLKINFIYAEIKKPILENKLKELYDIIQLKKEEKKSDSSNVLKK